MSHMTPEGVVTELRRTVAVMQDEAERAMRDAVELTHQRLTELTPRGSTGGLASDVTHSVRKTPEGVAGMVRPRKPYARFVEGGTGEGKTIRNKTGTAYSAASGHRLTAAEELADPFGVMTASGYGSKTGRPLKLQIGGGVIFRRRVRGQRARHFIQRTRESVATEVADRLSAGAQRAVDRLFP